MIRYAVVFCTAAVCVACCAGEWELHEFLLLHDDELQISDAQQHNLQTVQEPLFVARTSLAQSRDAIDDGIRQIKEAHAAAVRDVLTPDQQNRLDELFGEWTESASKDQLTKDVDHLTRLLPVLEKLKVLKAVTVLEGLERTRMAAPKPPNGPAMVQVDKHFFFEQPVELSKDDQLLLEQTVTSYRSFGTYAGGKFCGGFHPDANIRLATQNGMIQMLVCFGCAEIQIVDGANSVMVEIEKEAYWALEAICRRSFRHREGGVIPKVFSAPVQKSDDSGVGVEKP